MYTQMKTPSPYNKNPNMLVPYYLMLSYLYYEENESIVDDIEYDTICKRLYNEWDNIEHHHKHLVDRSSLAAGTGYHMKYNGRIKHAAIHLMKKVKR